MGQVHANGQPIDIGIAMQAAEWLTTLMSGQVTSAEKNAWTKLASIASGP